MPRRSHRCLSFPRSLDWPSCRAVLETSRRGEHGFQMRTAYRDAFQQNLYHTWKQMSRQTLVIRRGPGSPAVTQGAKPNGRS